MHNLHLIIVFALVALVFGAFCRQWLSRHNSRAGAQHEPKGLADADSGVGHTGTRHAVLMGSIIESRSTLVARTSRNLNFPQRHGVLLLALHRKGGNLRQKFENVPPAFGDTLLVRT
jgi:hypothetical protein